MDLAKFNHSGASLIMDSKLTAAIYGAQLGFLINPLEVLKTNFHLTGESKYKGKTSLRYKTINHSTNIVNVWRLEGSKLFFKGLIPSTFYYSFSQLFSVQAIQMSESLGIIKPKINQNISFKNSLQMASLAGLGAAILPSPLYLVKIRMQSKMNSRILAKTGYQHLVVYGGTVGLLRNIYETEVGPIGLYRAALSNYAKYTIMTSVSLYFYTRMRKFMDEYKVCADAWIPILSAISGGIIGAFIATPLDIVSTRFYNQGVSRYGGNMIYLNYKDCLYKIATKNGMRDIFKCSIPTTIALSFQSGLALYIWDSYKLIYSI